jgi:dynein heavy chain 1, cytosolic
MDDTAEQHPAALTEETAAIVASFDPTLVVEYLAELAVVVLDASRDDLLVSLLSYPDTLQRCSRFAVDPGSLVLYLRKEPGDASVQNGKPQSFSFPLYQLLTFSGVSNVRYVYFLSSEYSASTNTVCCIAVIKRPMPLDSSIFLQHQLQIVSLPVASGRSGQEAPTPFESLHSLVRLAIAPYFDSYTQGESELSVRRGKGMDEAKTGTWFQSSTDSRNSSN